MRFERQLTVHGNASHNVLTQVLLRVALVAVISSFFMPFIAYRNLKDELLAIVGGGQGVENGRQLLAVELDCINPSALFHHLFRPSGAPSSSIRLAGAPGEKLFSYRQQRHQ